jgi:MFS family permease
MSIARPSHRLIRNRRYLLWLASDTATGLSDALSGFAIPLLALMVTDEPAQAGIIGAVGLTARLVTTLAGGVLADRHDRIALMLAGGGIGIVLTGAFTALALADALTFTALLLLNTLIAARVGLFGIAGESAIKQLVPAEAMGRAQAANQGRDAALSLAGGPLGGVLLSAGGWLVGAVMTVCQAISLLTSWLLRRGTPQGDGGEPTGDRAGTGDGATAPTLRPSAWREAREGIVWLLGRADLRGVLLVSTIVNLGFNAAMTTVIYSLQQSGHSPASIGLVTAVISAAMLLGAIVSPFIVPRVGAGTIAVASLFLCTAGTLVLPLIHSVPAMVAILAASLFLVPSLNAGLLGYFTVATPSRLLGRANSASRVFAMGAMPFAPLIAGFGLSTIGRDGTILIAGAICLASAILAIATPSLRAVPKESGWTEHARRFGSE